MKPSKKWLEDKRFAFSTQFSFNQVAELIELYVKENQKPQQPTEEDIELAACRYVEKLDVKGIDPAVVAIHCYINGAEFINEYRNQAIMLPNSNNAVNYFSGLILSDNVEMNILNIKKAMIGFDFAISEIKRLNGIK